MGGAGDHFYFKEWKCSFFAKWLLFLYLDIYQDKKRIIFPLPQFFLGSDISQLSWNMVSGQGADTRNVAYFSQPQNLKKKKKHSKTSGNPKKQHIATLQKNLSVPKKQQHMAG